MSKVNRRTFIKSSLAASAAFSTFTIAGTKSSGQVIGANDTIRVGVAGIHGRGGAHISEYTGMKNVRVACLIDPDSRLFDKVSEGIQAKAGNKPKTVQDIREALDDKNIDAISVATPNHWHSLITIWACQAGKDVYVEKPCSHNIHEGRISVDTARKYNRIVQHGTQSRSGTIGLQAAELAKSGKYGKLLVSRGLVYKPRNTIGFKQPSEVPSGLDFNIWLGPAPSQPYHANLVHYNWHWFWDTGNGDIGNQGVHQMDIARWAIPGATFPKNVISLGGRFGYEDQGQTPNTQLSFFDFGETQLIFEVRGLKTDEYQGQKVGNSFHYEEGVLAGGKFTPKGSTEAISLPKTDTKRGPGGGHFGNFIAAVRSRKREDLNADILEGHYSAALCHLANISYRLGSIVPFNAQSKAFGDNKDAYETLGRMEEHLAGKNGLKLDGLKYDLGQKLNFDGQTEKFVDNPQADEMLTRQYRAPFVVPDKVV